MKLFQKIDTTHVQEHNTLKEKIIKKAIKKADTLGRTADEHDIQNIEKRIVKMNRGPVKDIWNTVQALWTGFTSSEIAAETKILILGALLYLVSPLDIIPDFLLPAGLLDDAAVIAFIYSQCKDLIERTIPKVTESIKNSIHEIGNAASEEINRITEDALVATVGKQFRMYCTRVFLNMVLKLSVFTMAIVLLYFSRPGFAIENTIASILLIISMVWILFSVVTTVYRIIKLLKRFIPALHRISVREKQNVLLDTQYKKLRWQDTWAEAMYVAFAECTTPKQHRFFFALVFRTWNEGKLPAWIPRKHALIAHMWNVLKVQLLIFIVVFICYFVVYKLIARDMLLPRVTDYSFLQLLIYPFTRIWQ